MYMEQSEREIGKWRLPAGAFQKQKYKFLQFLSPQEVISGFHCRRSASTWMRTQSSSSSTARGRPAAATRTGTPSRPSARISMATTPGWPTSSCTRWCHTPLCEWYVWKEWSEMSLLAVRFLMETLLCENGMFEKNGQKCPLYSYNFEWKFVCRGEINIGFCMPISLRFRTKFAPIPTTGKPWECTATCRVRSSSRESSQSRGSLGLPVKRKRSGKEVTVGMIHGGKNLIILKWSRLEFTDLWSQTMPRIF